MGLAIAISAGSRFIVSVVAGPHYAAAAPVLALQAFGLVASFVVAGCSYGLLSLHRHRLLLLVNLAALTVSIALTVVLASTDGARGAAIATICGETTLAAASIIALSWSRPAHRPRLIPAVKVLGAGGVAATASLIASMPSLVAAVIAVVVYGAIVLGAGVLPSEFTVLLPNPARRR